MSEDAFDYLESKDKQTAEEVWCKISPHGKLERFDWNFVEKMARDFDAGGAAAPKNNAQIICKLAVLIREQTIKQCAEVMLRYADHSALSNVLVLKDPLEDGNE